MLDRSLHPSLDALVAELEAVSGRRVQMLLDALPDGFAAVQPPSDSQPLTLIRVADRFSDHAYAIAALHVAGQIRSYRPGNGTKATVNESVLADLHREVVAGFGATVPAGKLPGLTRIFYDGISRQITSVLQVAQDHRVVAARCPDLRHQHVRFLDFLIGLNIRYFSAPSDDRNPAWLVKANHRLLGVETLALAAFRAGGKPVLMQVAEKLVADNPALAERGQAQHLLFAIPIVEALLGGLLDDLSDRQLAEQAVKTAGLREDWVDWIQPTGMEANAGSPMLPRDLAGKRATPDGTDAHARRVDAAIAMASHDPAAAKAALLELAAAGGSADQRTMTALAAVHERLGEGDEAMRVARISIGLDTSTDAAEEARGVINRVSAGRVHDVAPVRPDVVMYIRDAIATYNRLNRERGMGVWKEAAMLGMGGIALDGSRQYALKALPGKLMSGVHLTCYTYVGTRMFAKPDMLAMLGLPYDREWEAATRRT